MSATRRVEPSVPPLLVHRPGSAEHDTEVAWLVDDLHISPRQAAVGLAIRNGCCEKECAGQLDCSYHTVHSHVREAIARLRPLGVINQATLSAMVERSLARFRPS
jgi:DNA-binding NarL/FixJ family response regulator